MILPKFIRHRLLDILAGEMRFMFSGRKTRHFAGLLFGFDGYRDHRFYASDLDDLDQRPREIARRIIAARRPLRVWDVGAGAGFWTLWLATCVEKESRVRAFEPDGRHLAQLQLNVRRNELRVQVAPCALWSRSGDDLLTIDDTGQRSSLTGAIEGAVPCGVERVAVRTFDNQADPVPGFVRIDIGTSPLEVLRGAAESLAQRRTVFLLAGACQSSLDLLKAAGYVVQSLAGEIIDHPEREVLAAPERLPADLFA